MRAFDISPLLRSSIGYENLNRLVEFAGRVDGSETAYPPYNIEKLGDGAYRIAMAVAGFAENELDLTVQENTLIVTGAAQPEAEGEERVFLHRGIAKRAFAGAALAQASLIPIEAQVLLGLVTFG